MSYTVTLSGVDYSVDFTTVDYTVTLSQVGQQGSTGASWQGAWVTSTSYAVNDVVFNNGSSYICIATHTSSGTDEPGVGASTATYWSLLAQAGADGADGTNGVDGTDGDGFTGGSYNASTGVVTFTSDDGLGFTTSDLRGTDGTDGDGFTGGSYNASTGVVTFTSDDGLGFSTGDLRGADGADGVDGADGTSFVWESSWVTSTAFQVNDVVENDGSSYICILGHTSSASDEPGVGINTATYWELMAQKGADGAGSGSVTSVDVIGGTGITSSGGPVTSSGSITVSLDSATQTSLDLADTSIQPSDIGTSASLDVAVTGDAAVGEVVKGNDSRLTDARAPTAHSHVIADVTGLQTELNSKADDTNVSNWDTAYGWGDHALAGYLTSSDLIGYATETFVTSQGYLTSSDLTGYATETFVTSQGYITGYTVTESDVTAHEAALTITESQISDLGTYETADPDILKADTHDTLTAGFDSTTETLGTVSSGTITPEVDAANKENFKTLTANGAFTLAPPSTSESCTILIRVTNGASAGTITTSSFDIVNGDAYETTNGNDYFFHIKKVGSFSSLTIEALQ